MLAQILLPDKARTSPEALTQRLILAIPIEIIRRMVKMA